MRHIDILASLIMCVLFILSSIGCISTDGSKELESVQVTEYQGEKLSPIGEFHENSIKGPQQVNRETYRLKISGLVSRPNSFTYDDAINKHQHYKKVVTLDCVEGWSVTILWEGMLVKDLINEAGVLPNAKVIIFHAYDGYTTSLPLQYVIDNNLILADKMNDVVLPPDRGFPFQLVAQDKWGYKWIKWITEIELSDNENYRGYWEQAGYSNDGSLDKPFFER